MRRGLDALYPEARAARLLEERWLVREDCPGFAPGSHARRPGVVTPSKGVVLAGDFVKTRVPCALMERAATPMFGLQTYGINVNGLVRDGDTWKVWIARRAMTKHVDPGMLDLIVGGGVPYGISLADNLLKECAEEACIGPTLAERARPVSLTTMSIVAHEGLRIGVQFNYDLELPADFQPRNDDGEVAAGLHPEDSVIVPVHAGPGLR